MWYNHHGTTEALQCCTITEGICSTLLHTESWHVNSITTHTCISVQYYYNITLGNIFL